MTWLESRSSLLITQQETLRLALTASFLTGAYMGYLQRHETVCHTTPCLLSHLKSTRRLQQTKRRQTKKILLETRPPLQYTKNRDSITRKDKREQRAQKHDSLRFSVDVQKLNSWTVRNTYQLSQIDNSIDSRRQVHGILGARYWTRILKMGTSKKDRHNASFISVVVIISFHSCQFSS